MPVTLLSVALPLPLAPPTRGVRKIEGELSGIADEEESDFDELFERSSPQPFPDAKEMLIKWRFRQQFGEITILSAGKPTYGLFIVPLRHVPCEVEARWQRFYLLSRFVDLPSERPLVVVIRNSRVVVTNGFYVTQKSLNQIATASVRATEALPAK